VRLRLVALIRAKFCWVVACVLVASNVSAGDLPKPETSVRQYSLYYGDWSKSSARLGRAEARVQLDGQRYAIELIEHPEGLARLLLSGELRQTSTGDVNEHGFAPQRYVEKRPGKPDRIIEIDPQTGIVKLSRDQLTAPWAVGMQDRLSVTYQLGLLMRAHGSGLAPGTEFNFAVAALSEIDTMHFAVRGEETMNIGGKPLRTIHVTRTTRDPRKDNQIDAWFMPDDAMLPARLRVTDPSGRILDQVLD
jgi:hypothetical protein